MYLARSPRTGKANLLLLLISLLSLTSLTIASTPTSFCKCTCFTNSTIIPLDPAKSSSGSSAIGNVLNLYERVFENVEPDPADEPSENEVESRAQKYRTLSCNDCNRKFCLNYELPICKGAKEDDVFTTCFQRDSRKDEAVVFIFIFATGGLLAWALAKPWIERYLEAARERRSYMPVAEPDS